MPELSKKQIITIIGFIVTLLSIPLLFTLVQRTQIFKSRASEVKTTSVSQTAVISPKAVPKNSPLNDLKKLLEATSPSSTTENEQVTPTPTPLSAASLSFGPTLNLQITLEGRPKDNQTAKVFIGVISGAATASQPKYILSFTIDFPANGIFTGLSLAGLNPGSTYTVYVKGPAQIDVASTFVMSPTVSTLNNNRPLTLLSGDLNEDNYINSTDYTIAKNLYGTTSSYSIWNERADLNMDKVINNLDLVYITKNMGKKGASGIWYSPPPTASASATPTPTGSGSPSGGYESSGEASIRTGGYWIWVP